MDRIIKEMHDFAAIAAFRKIAETRNITVAAQELHITPSAVSRQITRLEESLGVQLLVRTTRHLRLTKLGEQFYKSCAKGLVEVEHAIQVIAQVQEEPRGTLRIGVTPFFGTVHLLPAILVFLKLHPKVSIVVSLHHLETSFHESGVDILVRAGLVRGRNIMHEDLAPIRHVICATPGYLKKYGVPHSAKELMQHNCLLSTRSSPNRWPLIKGGRREYVPVSGNFRTDSVEVLYRAVLDGTGIARLSNYVVGPELRNGRLLSLFPAKAKGHHNEVIYETTTNTMKANYLKSSYPDPKTREFIQFLKERFKANYNWEHRDGRL